ncbi:ThuA domain-containing protein [Haloferula sp.]|uniref:ThuA domain-containing protein n=1 Tax=Haloferula sp. TaxID=2497595 RepID=UPI00329B7D14
MNFLKLILFAGLIATVCQSVLAEDEKPHAVFVLGTLHYSPELTMPVFAKELERFGFRTSIVRGEGDPEKKTENVLPNIGLLKDADVVIFFSRFLKLPDEEWQVIEEYLKSGKPVLGLRTANHSFKYPKEHPRFAWNDDFGRRVLGSPYIVHQAGETKLEVVPEAMDHPIMSHVTKREWTSPGTLYLAMMEEGCVPLLMGSGKGRARILKKSFGEIRVKEHETAAVAWAWKNEWGGKSFYSSLGHPGDFADEASNRLLLNAICWAADSPLPPKEAKITTWEIERVDKKKKKAPAK